MQITSNNQQYDSLSFGHLKKITYNKEFRQMVDRETGIRLFTAVKDGSTPLGRVCNIFDEVKLHFDFDPVSKNSRMTVKYRNNPQTFFQRGMRMLGLDWNKKQLKSHKAFASSAFSETCHYKQPKYRYRTPENRLKLGAYILKRKVKAKAGECKNNLINNEFIQKFQKMLEQKETENLWINIIEN